jgi:hypothetical protein
MRIVWAIIGVLLLFALVCCGGETGSAGTSTGSDGSGSSTNTGGNSGVFGGSGRPDDGHSGMGVPPTEGGWSGKGDYYGSGVRDPFSDGSDNIFKDDTRTYEITTNDDGSVKVEGKNEDDTRTDRLEFGIKFDDGTNSDEDRWMTFTMNYERNEDGSKTTGDGSTVDEGSSCAIEVGFCGIVEFKESGDDKGFDSKDEIVEKSDMPTFNSFEDTSDSEDYNKLATKSTDGQFEVNVYLANAGATLESGVEISANEMKFDIKINNKTYSADGTRLAVCMRVSNPKGGAVNEHKDETTDAADAAVNGFTSDSDNGDATSFFTWITVALTNGESGFADIIASIDADSGNVYFTFDTDEQPTEIYWDPTVGVSGKSVGSSSGNSGSTVGVSLVGVVVAAIAVFMN